MNKLLLSLMLLVCSGSHAAEWANVDWQSWTNGGSVEVAIDISTTNISLGEGKKSTWRRTHFKVPYTTMYNTVIFTNETIDCKRKMWKATYLESYDNNILKEKKTEGFPWNFFDLSDKRDATIYRLFCQ